MNSQNEIRKIFKIVLAGVILKDNKILLLKRHKNEKVFPGIWELPSGKREFGETSNEALKREINEETGLNVDIIKPLSVFEYVIEKTDEIRDTTQINFILKLKDIKQQSQISQEHEEAAWFGKDEIDRLPNITEETKKVLLQAFNQE